MKKSDIFPTKYLKGSDIEGREINVVISDSRMEDVGGDEDKLVIRFQGATKGLVCNATNFDRIAYISGSGDTVDWVGCEVVLYTEIATFPGRPPAPAVRVKVPLKKQAGPAREASPQPGQVGGYDTKIPTTQHGHDDGGDEIPF